MKKPLVSILIPSYNQTELLSKTLESIATQTYRDFEVLVCDDSANNLVEDLVAAYRTRFGIRYIRNKPSLGSPANWNKALDEASGTLIKFMHHDDWFAKPDALQKFVQVFESDPHLQFVFCDSEILNLSTGKVSYNRAGVEFTERLRKDPKLLFDHNLIGAPTATMFRKNNLRFDEKIKFVVDVDFYIKQISAGKFIYIAEPLVVNTTAHSGQVTEASRVKEVELGEFVYLYNKLFPGKIPSALQSMYFIRMLRNYKVMNFDELAGMLGGYPQPKWYFRLLFNISLLNRKS